MAFDISIKSQGEKDFFINSNWLFNALPLRLTKCNTVLDYTMAFDILVGLFLDYSERGFLQNPIDY